MRVHIVTLSLSPDNVISRMMRWLVEEYGWSLSPQKARSDVDVNYYGSYLAYGHSKPVRTLKAGYFTHFEDHAKWKVNLWNKAAEELDLRCVNSSLYVKSLKKFGFTAKITPGIDRDFFTPQTPRPNKNRVGMAAAGSPRKGLALLERLIESEPEIEVSLAGKNLEQPTMWLPWNKMPQFYRDLDVYLVTSTIEGIPIPPLEALACGVKVVVPRKVGIMDELPEMKGIRHYKKGDYKDMTRAIKLVLTDKVSQEELRAITGKYTIKAWCESNKKAIEKMI